MLKNTAYARPCFARNDAIILNEKETRGREEGGSSIEILPSIIGQEVYLILLAVLLLLDETVLVHALGSHMQLLLHQLIPFRKICIYRGLGKSFFRIKYFATSSTPENLELGIGHSKKGLFENQVLFLQRSDLNARDLLQ